MKTNRRFWWLFEVDDEDAPASDLQGELAGRKRAPVAQYSRKSRFSTNLKSKA